MTLIVGCHTVDGVLMAADCRLVVQSPGGESFVVDDAQKTILLRDRTVLGYAGDLETVALLFGQLFSNHLKSRRMDPVSVRRWLPRFLRAAYSALVQSYPDRIRECTFLVGATLPGRQQSVRLGDVWELGQRTSRLGHSNILSMRLLNEFMAGKINAVVPGSSAGMLYEMRSPNFVPRDYGVLEYAAIGSATPCALGVLERYLGPIFSDSPKLGLGWFMEAFAAILAENPDESVGGMFLVSALSHGKVMAMLAADTTPGLGSELVIENDRFVQVDRGTGQRIPLRYPGEILGSPPQGETRFSPYREGWSEPLELKGRTVPAFNLKEVYEELQARGVFCRQAAG